MMNEQRIYKRDKRSPIPKNELTSKIMSSIKGKNTGPEIAVRKKLWEKGIRGYRLHWKVPGKPDLAFPGKKIAIFINGCYWHRCPNCQLPTPKEHSEYWLNKFAKNVARDKKKMQELERMNWAVLVLWECEIKKDIHQTVEKISTLLENCK